MLRKHQHNMLSIIYKTMGYALIIPLLLGCKREADEIIIKSSSSSFLKFADEKALREAIAIVGQEKNTRQALQKIVGTLAMGPDVANFHSLADNPDKNVPVFAAKPKKVVQSLKSMTTNSSLSANGTTLGGLDGVTTDRQIVSDQLVPDTNFATILNDDLQVQVGQLIYMVTPDGTFSAEASNRAALEAMVNDRTLSPDDAPIGTLLTEDFYDMGGGITRYDTFADVQSNFQQQDALGTSGTSGTLGTSPCDITQPDPQYVSLTPQLNQQQYCSFPVYAYGPKTVLGRLLTPIFGVNTSRTNNFDSNHRIELKLYNFNYWVYSSIGLKTKFQKKGFLSLWGSMKPSRLVVGWDMVMFERPIPFSPPNPIQVPSFPSSKLGTAVAKETLKFINFEIPASMVSELASGLVPSVYKGMTFGVSPSQVEQELVSLEGKAIGSLSEKIWNYANSQLAPSQVAFQKSITAGFRMIYADKETVALSRWEKSESNTEEINLVFDFNTCRVTYNGTIGGDFKFADNVLKPTYDNKAMSYVVKKASVYGAAQYGGGWKGIRIVQE